MISTAPFAFRIGETGFVALFRYGVVVLGGLSPIEEDDVLRKLTPRVAGALPRLDDEVAVMEISADKEDQVPPGGPIQVRDLSPERILVVADALAKSVALAHNERQVSAVFDVIDPLARDLARAGRVPARPQEASSSSSARRCWSTTACPAASRSRTSPMSCGTGRISSASMPASRTNTNSASAAARSARKLDVVQETARALTDLIDAQRSVRLEATIVLLIVFEILDHVLRAVHGHEALNGARAGSPSSRGAERRGDPGAGREETLPLRQTIGRFAPLA